METHTHESYYSGSVFNTLNVEATEISTVMLESVELLRDEWISILEVSCCYCHHCYRRHPPVARNCPGFSSCVLWPYIPEGDTSVSNEETDETTTPRLLRCLSKRFSCALADIYLCTLLCPSGAHLRYSLSGQCFNCLKSSHRPRQGSPAGHHQGIELLSCLYSR